MLMMIITRQANTRRTSNRIANMGTVSAATNNLERKLQETKKPAHPYETIARAPGSKLSFSLPPPENVLRSSGFGLGSHWKPFSMMGEAHDRTNITRGRTVKKLYFT
jgi:hypothetical protein